MRHIDDLFKNKFSDQELIEILAPFIPNGWEIFEPQMGGLKIRRPYLENEIAYNEDGYMYKMMCVNFSYTCHYLRLLKLGYTFSDNCF